MTKLTQSYVHGASIVPLIGETLGVHFDRAVARWRDELALVVRHQQVRWSYGELGRRVDDFAGGLLALGLEPGDRVGIWSPNNAEWVITQFATAKAGLVLVNINPAYRLTEVEYALNKVGCKALITADHFKTSDYVGMLRELAPELDRSAPGRLSAERLPSLSAVIRIGADERPGMFRFADIMVPAASVMPGGSANSRRRCNSTIRSTSSSPAARPARPRARRSRIIISSTTATSSARRSGSRHATALQSRCRSITASAWCWAILPASRMARRWSIRVRASSPWPSSRRSKPRAAPRCTACRPCSSPSSTTPNSNGSILSSLRTGIMAGSPCPIEVMRRCVDEMHMSEVTIAYGMTETSPVSFQTSHDDPLERRVGTVGRVHPHVEVKIVNAEGRIVPPGTPGELCTRGYSVCSAIGAMPSARRRRSTARAGCTPAISRRSTKTAIATSSGASRTW